MKAKKKLGKPKGKNFFLHILAYKPVFQSIDHDQEYEFAKILFILFSAMKTHLPMNRHKPTFSNISI